MVEALLQVRASAAWADGYEFRLDLIVGLDLHRLFRSTRKPLIATLRPEWEGGRFHGEEKERLDILLEAGARGAEYIDVELRAGKEAMAVLRRHLPGTRLIVSQHDETTPTSSADAYQRLRGAGGDIVKWAFPAGDSPDLRFVIDFLQSANRDRLKAVSIATGEPGEASRILYRRFGAWATYAAPEYGPHAGEGQVPASMLKRVYRSHRLTKRTKIFGVLGNPVRQSKGIYVHNAAFSRQHSNAVYVRFPTTDLERFARDLLPHIHGCSVTIPFKEQVQRYCDQLDPGAIATGATNTLFRHHTQLRGANTDASAALDAIERVIRVRGKILLVVGAGGAARALVFEATRRGGEVVVTNRTFERAAILAKESGASAVPFNEVLNVNYAILANATPVGMYPAVDQMPVPRELLRPETVVFDVVYAPRVTFLLRTAKEEGARIVEGMEMYVLQAARQSELFLGKRADIRLIRRTINSLEKGRRDDPAHRAMEVSGTGRGRRQGR
jgi:3-dehydroquinate dehydratase/shikimate dehydrogenase